MKYSKILSALALAIIFSLLTLIIPPAPAMAQSASASATTSLSGTTVSVTGTGFTADSSVLIYFPDTSSASLKTSASTGATGYFYTTFSIGEYPAGSKTLWVKDGSTLSWYPVSFTVTPYISLSPITDYVGEEIAVDGAGFAASKDITIYFYTSLTSYVDVGTASTDANGSFTGATFTVPESYRGSHTVKAVDGSSNSDTASFTTKQSITISPTSGAVGTEVTVTGTGFGANKYMTITFDGDAVTTSPSSVKADATGSFSAKFTILSCIKGTYEVKAREGTTIYKGSANFVVSAGATLSPTTGNVGTSLTVTGTGFIANGTVFIKYDGTQVTTANINASGAFSATFDAPVSIGGSHTITATDDTNTKTLTFTMESTSPPIPAPLLPEMGVKADSKAYFDWEDVDDPSLPITYTLQIATDADFTSTSIVLEKEDLTTSEYTLTEEEKLESTEEEAPYYWRVKAIDGASNESGWSGTGSFYVGGFALGGWIKYVLYVLGGLALVALGFWLSRRVAYY